MLFVFSHVKFDFFSPNDLNIRKLICLYILRGDYRTGKRLNMRKVIPYIASQFRKDKIWLRRTKPSKRQYQIMLAIDDSSSMVDNHSKQVKNGQFFSFQFLNWLLEWSSHSYVTPIWSNSTWYWTLMFVSNEIHWHCGLCSLSISFITFYLFVFQLAFESLAMISNALTLLEAGELGICR